MPLSRTIRIKLVSWMVVVAVAAPVGAIYSHTVYPAGSLNPGDWRVGMVTGALIALLSIPLEIFSRDFSPMVWVRKLPTGINWLVRSGIHFAIILFTLLGTQYVFDVFIYRRVLFSTISVDETAQDAIFCVIVLIATVFILEMRALLGGRVVATALFGGYSAPTEKQMIFLIVDMVKSSETAATLGGRRYHGFLSAVFKLVEVAVEEEEGEIYTFVGDALIASWPLDTASRNGRALRAVQSIFDALDKASSRFEDLYGTRPRVRAVLHGGNVILGQYGEMRRQVTYLGEVLNVTSRMERFAKQAGCEILVSHSLLAKSILPEGLTVAPLPAKHLALWQGNVELMILRRAGSVSQVPSLAANTCPIDPKRTASRQPIG
jgi:adenylate cyclase